MTALVRSAARRRGRTRKWKMGIGTAGRRLTEGGTRRRLAASSATPQPVCEHFTTLLVVTPWLEERERESASKCTNGVTTNV